MLKNYLKITFRNMTRHLVYVLINVTGLGLALAVCIVAYLNYHFDADFDKFHEKSERIFRVEHTQRIEGVEQPFASSPALLGPAIKDDISGIDNVVRVARDLMPPLLKAGENEDYERLIYADPEIFDLFSFQLISGNKNSFRDQNTVFITQKLALALFGDQDPVGEIVSINDAPFTVGGVLKNHPSNSSFQFEALVPIQVLYKEKKEPGWGNIYGIASTFILVKDPSQTGAIEKSMQMYVPVVNEVNFHQVERFYLAPFKDMAHQGRNTIGHPFQSSIHPAALWPPLIAAVCILLIACFNFTNTSIAMAGKRLKEIGIRKVAGGLRPQIMLQFMGENLLLALFALILALFFARYLVPAYSAMWDFIDLSFSFTKNPELWLFIILILVATTVMAGLYPALYISSFNPVRILRDKLSPGGRNVFSKAILGLQFGITTLALFTGIAFIQNAQYQRNFDPGFDGDHLIEVLLEDKYADVFRNALQSYPEIESVCKSVSGPFFNTMSVHYKETRLDAKMKFLELESFSTMGLRLLEGRFFEHTTENTDLISTVLVNRKFTEVFGMDNPVGKTITVNDTLSCSIIGVVENLLNEGVFTTEISPIFYRLAGQGEKTSGLWIRVDPENRKKAYAYLEEEWNRLFPDRPFMGIEGDVFTEASQYISKKILSISFFLALIAALLSVAGLYSQISLVIMHRTKEIGIRKVFGASVPGMIRMLNAEFLVILLMGAIAGVMAGYYLNSALMASIWVYFTGLPVLIFILPVLIIIAVSFLTIGGKVYDAATRNPAHSLRYE